MSFSWLKYWCEGFVLLSIILVGTTANFFSVIIIRNRELSLVQVNDSFFLHSLQHSLSRFFLAEFNDPLNLIAQWKEPSVSFYEMRASFAFLQHRIIDGQTFINVFHSSYETLLQRLMFHFFSLKTFQKSLD